MTNKVKKEPRGRVGLSSIFKEHYLRCDTLWNVYRLVPLKSYITILNESVADIGKKIKNMAVYIRR